MGLFTKDEEVPEIPPAPKLPELPSFPANSKNDNFNQEMVKSAVADMPSPGENEVNVEIPKGLNVTEEPKGESLIPQKPSEESLIPNIPEKRTLEITPSTPSIETKPASKQIEPIFVRIDKFQSAQKNFEKIKDKVKEIESVLKKIKDVKSQEEVELKGWTEDIEKIKARLSEVDAGIFSQV